jgi:hypothetical protein
MPRSANKNLLFALLGLVALIAVGTAVALAVRLILVEPESVAAACVAGRGWRCTLRELAVAGFLNNVYGTAAVVLGAFATIARSRWLAAAALLCGCFGAVLFSYQLSGAGLLLGALVWVRPRPHGKPNHQDQPSTQPNP